MRAAFLLASLLALDPLSARAAVVRVEVSPLAGPLRTATLPLSAAASMPAPEAAAALAAAPELSAPAAVVAAPTETLLPQAASGSPRGASRDVATIQEALEAAESLRKAPGLFDGSEPDLHARDYAEITEEDLRTATNGMLTAQDQEFHRTLVKGLFGPDLGVQKRIVAGLVQRANPQELSGFLSDAYNSLRTAYFSDQPSAVRAGVSSFFQDSTHRFLDGLSANPAMPDAARRLAREIRERFLMGDRLLASLAWGRREKGRIAAGRRELAAEVRALPDHGKKTPTPAIEADSASRNWAPPGPDAAAPSAPESGVTTLTKDLNGESREFADSFARFQLARDRRNASQKMRLSAAGAAREKKRWDGAVAAFTGQVSAHEYIVDYALNHTFRITFAAPDGFQKPLGPPPPGASLRETADGYLLQAPFETKIQDASVIAAVRRSIESYWRGTLEENGRTRRFETVATVRVLGPDEGFSSASLRLEDGGSASSGRVGHLALSRKFNFSVPAHEFGHVLGLSDEYTHKYFPERMTAVQEQDRSSLMASLKGLILPRHLITIVAAMRQAGRLDPAVGPKTPGTGAKDPP